MYHRSTYNRVPLCSSRSVDIARTFLLLQNEPSSQRSPESRLLQLEGQIRTVCYNSTAIARGLPGPKRRQITINTITLEVGRFYDIPKELEGVGKRFSLSPVLSNRKLPGSTDQVDKAMLVSKFETER
jgi:hypothetical protein